MGEVYRACDTRLGRDVAVKVLNHPLPARGDPFLQRLRGELRFQRLLERIEPEGNGSSRAFARIPERRCP